MSLKKEIIFETTFATYKAKQIIGEGGCGRIYEALDDSGDSWAIKWLNPIYAGKEKTKRFKNELQFCLRNKHQNIVTVTDHGIFIQDEKRLPFYVMPLYKVSLRGLLKSGIPTDKALGYFAHILDGVEAAHMQGVIHRDIKPENILYDADKDLLVVADFGIAHFQEDALFTAVETNDSTRLANFQYAAPEQRTRGLKVDHRADIYALGLILNEIFTGKVPDGTGYKVITGVAPDYGYLDALVDEMLRQDPDDRCQTIEAVKQHLIAHNNEFVTQQRLSELKGTVISVGEIDDPLIADPLRLVNFDWEHDMLTLFFQHPVNETWIWAFKNIGSYTSVLGKGPGRFSFSDNKAVIPAEEREVQDIINHFKDWLPRANQKYERRIREHKASEEKKRRQELQQQIELREVRQRVLKNTKI